MEKTPDYWNAMALIGLTSTLANKQTKFKRLKIVQCGYFAYYNIFLINKS